jgi:aspartyl-tRNA(Asn)/glutamyl-tRNA(Gln) amidotransferase subunit A
MTIGQALEALSEGETTATELVGQTLDAAETLGARLGAFLTVDREGALASAEASDERRRRGDPLGALDGVPIALKDILITKDLRTTAGSKLLDTFIPPYEGTVVARLKAAGAAIVGKTNLDEFAMGSSNENSAFTTVGNPWNEKRIPGGSSGGSAAAVAADLCCGAMGTDTGGSIRQPASHCGIVGLKPTYGRVSRYGVIAFASSLDQVGPMAKTVEGCARLLEVIAGFDPKDSTSAELEVPRYTDRLDRGLDGLRVGVPDEYFVAGLDPAVEEAVRGAISALEGAGAVVEGVSLPHTKYALSTYYLIAPAEASSNLARYDGVRYTWRSPDAGDLHEMYMRTRWDGFGAEVRRRIMLGTFVLSAGYYDAYYLKAQKVRTLIRQDFERVFRKVDVLATPTAPTAAFELGTKTDDPLSMYLSDIYTLSCNLAGIPGMSVPCALSPDGLPIGLQLLGRPFDEETLLQVAAGYEKLRGPFPKAAVVL